jgi:hypothetical protein
MIRVVLLALLLCTACDSATDGGSGALEVLGTWTYTGTQSSPPLNIHGTLRIDEQDGVYFSGSVDLTESDVQGTVRNRTGQVSGRVVGGDAVDFDVFIEAAARRHVAALRGDSMSGAWAQSSVVPAITGNFVARKAQ